MIVLIFSFIFPHIRSLIDVIMLFASRLHWAGTEVSNVHRGYISGAVKTGSQAARDVMKRLNSN